MKFNMVYWSSFFIKILGITKMLKIVWFFCEIVDDSDKHYSKWNWCTPWAHTKRNLIKIKSAKVVNFKL